MFNCTNCLAKNSFKKSVKDGLTIYICEYCNIVKEDFKEDTDTIALASAKDLVAQVEEAPEYNKKNVTTFNVLIVISIIISLLIFIVVATDTSLIMEDILEIFGLNSSE
ncbi:MULTISPECIES: hypothetical protein [Lysinibacillus]|uniref:Uncharacterized protein n=1 Tax=Lysinibacillus tabacifolii TaxID=1173107 RepID=A0ABY2T3U4_9BACI|nr:MULTISPECIES: hypothetical protein [Lysinibacillus]MCS1384109.1 hypothetical protein [Lysinibacillus sphaericus]TKI50671.1 hypothetical protein FC748_05540 [Lysinibacillus tabacifolii]